MLKALFKNTVGVIAALLYIINMVFSCSVLFMTGFLRILPIKPWQRLITRIMNQLPLYWAHGNYLIYRLTTSTRWQITGLESLSKKKWYLVVANHQSWADILVLQSVLNYRVPMPKFFLKKELLWSLPIASWACWLLDYPFMHRYGKAFLTKHPELKGKDIENTKKACEKFKHIPTTVTSFVEGTRFSEEKKQHQQSSYQYLLRPKAPGIAFALATMGNYFNNILNITIVYPNEKINFWDFICGNVKKVIVHIDVLPITADLLGDYENDRQFRVYFQSWLNQLWQQKDTLIAKILHDEQTAHRNA